MEDVPKNLDEICGKGHIAGHDEGNFEGSTEQEKALVTEEKIMEPVDFKEGCFGMRGDIELLKSKVKNWQGFTRSIDFDRVKEDEQEIFDNLVLAYRHLEDARMRIGKAIQAYDGGKSCYPK